VELDTLRQAGLTANAKKCKLGFEDVEYLGYGKPQERKVQVVCDWPVPRTKKWQVLPKTVKWSDEAEAVFRHLKEALCSHPILGTHHFQVLMLVQTDACDTGLGAILSQVYDGEEHPIMYERECLAVKWALDTLKYYLLGTHSPWSQTMLLRPGLIEAD
jgi:hypothetical protein